MNKNFVFFGVLFFAGYFFLACSSQDNTHVLFFNTSHGELRKNLTPPKNTASILTLPYGHTGQDPVNTTLETVLLPHTSTLKSAHAFATSHLTHPFLKTAQFEAKLHTQTLQIVDRLNQTQIGFPKYAPKISSSKTQSAQTLNITSPFESDASASIEGKRIYSSDQADIYIDSRYQNELSTEVAQTLGEKFVGVSLKRQETLFGVPSDIDQNGKVLIFFSAEEKVGSGVLGFFDPKDLLPAEALGGRASNEAEILYIRIPGPSDPLPLFHATLAHELFHLIHFNQKTLKRLLSNAPHVPFEETFINEGLAHLAEELSGWSSCTPLFVKTYLDCFNTTALFSQGPTQTVEACAPFASTSDSLPRRGGMMLFFLYLVQQFGIEYGSTSPQDIQGNGVLLLREWVRSENTGLKNIVHSTHENLDRLFGKFLVTLALDNTNLLNDDRYRLDEPFTDPITSQPRNIRMRSTWISQDQTVDIGALPFTEENPYAFELRAGMGKLHVTPAPPATLFDLSLTHTPKEPAMGTAVIFLPQAISKP